MGVFSSADRNGHTQVLFGADDATGLKAIIAIHSTALGPALGGTRFYPYASEDDALKDVLRLSRGMTPEERGCRTRSRRWQGGHHRRPGDIEIGRAAASLRSAGGLAQWSVCDGRGRRYNSRRYGMGLPRNQVGCGNVLCEWWFR